jgi:hypothetical protein
MTPTVAKSGMHKMRRIAEVAFPDIAGRLMSLYWLTRLTHTPAGVAVELGVRNGDSTRAILAACEDCGQLLYSFDIEDVRAHVPSYTTKFGLPWFQAGWRFSRQDSVSAGRLWNLGPVDMVFIDTDHTYETTRDEIAAWSPHVRLGGCLAFHDYWMTSSDAPRNGVKPAVDEWCAAYPREYKLETWARWEGDTGFAVIWKV